MDKYKLISKKRTTKKPRRVRVNCPAVGARRRHWAHFQKIMCLLLSGLKQNEMGMGPARLGSCAVCNKEVFEEADFYEKGGPIAKLAFWAVTNKK